MQADLPLPITTSSSPVLPQDSETPGCLSPTASLLTWLEIPSSSTHPPPCHSGKPLIKTSQFILALNLKNKWNLTSSFKVRGTALKQDFRRPPGAVSKTADFPTLLR